MGWVIRNRGSKDEIEEEQIIPSPDTVELDLLAHEGDIIQQQESSQGGADTHAIVNVSP